MNIRSTIGRRPVTAAPMPRPMIACSLIGVSTTRRSPNSLLQAVEGAEHAAVARRRPRRRRTRRGRPPSPELDGLVERRARSVDRACRVAHAVARRSRVNTSASSWSARRGTGSPRRTRSPSSIVGAQLGPRPRRARRASATPASISRSSNVKIGSRSFHASDLVVGAVLEAEVLDAVVVVEAVGLGLDQRRPVAAPGPGDGLDGRLVDGDDVHAVDDHAGHAVAGGAVDDVGDRHRLVASA